MRQHNFRSKRVFKELIFLQNPHFQFGLRGGNINSSQVSFGNPIGRELEVARDGLHKPVVPKWTAHKEYRFGRTEHSGRVDGKSAKSIDHPSGNELEVTRYGIDNPEVPE